MIIEQNTTHQNLNTVYTYIATHINETKIPEDIQNIVLATPLLELLTFKPLASIALLPLQQLYSENTNAVNKGIEQIISYYTVKTIGEKTLNPKATTPEPFDIFINPSTTYIPSLFELIATKSSNHDLFKNFLTILQRHVNWNPITIQTINDYSILDEPLKHCDLELIIKTMKQLCINLFTENNNSTYQESIKTLLQEIILLTNYQTSIYNNITQFENNIKIATTTKEDIKKLTLAEEPSTLISIVNNHETTLKNFKKFTQLFKNSLSKIFEILGQQKESLETIQYALSKALEENTQAQQQCNREQAQLAIYREKVLQAVANSAHEYLSLLTTRSTLKEDIDNKIFSKAFKTFITEDLDFLTDTHFKHEPIELGVVQNILVLVHALASISNKELTDITNITDIYDVSLLKEIEALPYHKKNIDSFSGTSLLTAIEQVARNKQVLTDQQRFIEILNNQLCKNITHISTELLLQTIELYLNQEKKCTDAQKYIQQLKTDFSNENNHHQVTTLQESLSTVLELLTNEHNKITLQHNFITKSQELLSYEVARYTQCTTIQEQEENNRALQQNIIAIFAAILSTTLQNYTLAEQKGTIIGKNVIAHGKETINTILKKEYSFEYCISPFELCTTLWQKAVDNHEILQPNQSNPLEAIIEEDDEQHKYIPDSEDTI
jgi:hypothetical protein